MFSRLALRTFGLLKCKGKVWDGKLQAVSLFFLTCGFIYIDLQTWKI